MIVNCAICSDNIDSTSDVWSTKCGHVFHNACVNRWLERSQTCPQCRRNTSGNDIYRLYFNTGNETEVQNDSLPSQIERLKSQITTMQLEARRALEREHGLRNDYENVNEMLAIAEVTHVSLREQVEQLQRQVKQLQRQVQHGNAAKNEACELRNTVAAMRRELIKAKERKPSSSVTLDDLQNSVSYRQTAERMSTRPTSDLELELLRTARSYRNTVSRLELESYKFLDFLTEQTEDLDDSRTCALDRIGARRSDFHSSLLVVEPRRTTIGVSGHGRVEGHSRASRLPSPRRSTPSRNTLDYWHLF